ncbi:MAG: flavodoxin-like domain-containing protein [Chitinispirillales bacterium]|jgi:flavodoxin|nr:flavodoxin-like domain-containing protein [Chitinispirillales bacterium]
MKIAIVIHTSTGHTLKFAQAIRDAIEAKNQGHEVDILGLRTIGTASPAFIPGGGRFTIKSPPEIDEYDAVLVGGPVWVFGPSPVVMQYIVEDIRTLKGKKALSFVTMWGFGGKRALRKMDNELEASGADMLEGEALVYFMKANVEKMKAAVGRICEKLGI